jgi:uncharacterized membrane protein
MQKFKLMLKELFLTKQGWLSWLVANVVTSLTWVIPALLGFLLQNNRLYIIAGSIWTFMMLPVTPFWVVNLFIAVWLRKKIFTNHSSKKIKT